MIWQSGRAGLGPVSGCAVGKDFITRCWPPPKALSLFMPMYHAAAITPEHTLVVFGARTSMHAPIPAADFEIP